mgnify:CR=1 FL=1
MPSLVFSHTKVREREHLSRLLEEREWFKHENFPVFLPRNQADVQKEIQRKNELLTGKAARLQKEWEKIEAEYFGTVGKFHHRKLLSKYICHVSRFGPEGKYHKPNMLFIRLRTARDEKQATETIAHELLHLVFADLFDSKGLNYAEREGMVDALIIQSNLSYLFPRYQKQSIGRIRWGLLKSICDM